MCGVVVDSSTTTELSLNMEESCVELIDMYDDSSEYEVFSSVVASFASRPVKFSSRRTQGEYLTDVTAEVWFVLTRIDSHKFGSGIIIQNFASQIVE